MNINNIVIIFTMLIFIFSSIDSVIAQGITKGPPPPMPLTVIIDKDVYLVNETIKITGNVETPKSGQSVMVQIYYPNNEVYLSNETQVSSDGTYIFEQKIEGKVVSGEYKVEVFYGDFGNTARFMIITGPYNVTVDGKNYPIEYKINTGILSGIILNNTEKSLTVHITNSSHAGELTIKLPRSVVDAKTNNNNSNQDGNFVLLMNNRPTNLQQTNFVEIAHDDDSRTLLIIFPYNGTNTLYDEWYIKILGTNVVPEFSGIGLIILATALSAVLVARLIPKINYKIH